MKHQYRTTQITTDEITERIIINKKRSTSNNIINNSPHTQIMEYKKVHPRQII